MGRKQLIERNKDILGGTPVFADTRVPVQTLFDYLEGGHTLNDFLDDFPTVDRDVALGILNLAARQILTVIHENPTRRVPASQT